MHCTNRTWAGPQESTVWLVFPPFSFPYSYVHLYYLPTTKHLIHKLQAFSFSSLLSSLWSSFWEAVCPDTLKLWYTPTKNLYLLAFLVMLFTLQSIFISHFPFCPQNSMKYVGQVLSFSCYVFRKWSEKSKTFWHLAPLCVQCFKSVCLVLAPWVLCLLFP